MIEEKKRDIYEGERGGKIERKREEREGRERGTEIMRARRGGRERYYRDRKREAESEKIMIVGRGRERH